MTNKTQFKPIDEYLETLSENVQSILEKVRQIIQKRLPKPETISHGIPRQHAYNLFKTLKRKRSQEEVQADTPVFDLVIVIPHRKQ
jgi:hypothetical protein